MLTDLRYALRTLRRSPGFTAVAGLTLALGIGANTAVFSIVEGVLLRSLPFPRADRLVDIKRTYERYRQPGIGGTSPFTAFETWRTAQGVFEDMAGAIGSQPVLLGHGDADRVRTAWTVTANFFPLLGAQPLLGRGFLREDDRPGSPPVVVLSHGFWWSQFGGDPHVLGRTLTLDTTRYTVVGVMPPRFQYPADAKVWQSLGFLLSGPAGARWRREQGFWVIGRLLPGITPAGAQAALDVVTRQAWEREPGDKGLVPVVTPLHDYLLGGARTPLLVMLAAVTLVLLVACANVAGLLTCRATAREHDLAVRVALGVSRARLVRETLTEAVLVALGGGALGVLVALWAVPLLVQLAGTELPRIADITVNRMVLAAALGVSILAGVVAGLVPALRAARHAPAAALRAHAGNAAAPPWRHRSTDLLIAAQLAVTMVLLAGAGLLGRSFLRLVRLDPGFEAEHVVVAELFLPETKYATPHRRAAFARDVLARVRTLPGVVAAAVSEGMPLSGAGVGAVRIPRQPNDPERPWAWFSAVTPDYFRTLGIPLRRGEAFAEGQTDAAGVVIDDAAAVSYFPGQDPLGQAITFGGGRTGTVLGVVGNTRQEYHHTAAPPHIYELLASHPAPYLKVLARTAGDPAGTVGVLRRSIRGLDPDVPIERAAPLTAWMGDAIASQRLYAVLLAIFAAIALAVAATGVYGIAAYSVARRRHEIGIRIALGARRRAVLELIVGHGMALTLGGVGVGGLATIFATRVLKDYLFEVGSRDPLVLASVGLLLVATAVVASYVPARRAMKVDPMVALRYE